jgi:DNA-binding transcriptional ArsR family regulator
MTNTAGSEADRTEAEMPVQAGFAKIAALLADPVREAMLVALADGRALPAGELAEIADVTPQSASGHLRQLVEGGVVSVWPQGRFRYFRLADEDIAAALEALVRVADSRPGRAVAARTRPSHLLAARCCYNHMAGRLGVAFADALVGHGYVSVADDSARLTSTGVRWLEATGVHVPKTRTDTRRHLKLCLDWTERRFHLAGSISNAVLHHLLESDCLVRGKERSLNVTVAGKVWFGQLGIST